MRDRFAWLIGAALAGAVACSGDGSGPSPGGGDDEAARLAARFNRLADSVAGAGLSPTAEALRHAGEIVRLTGHATPVTLTIDGRSRPFQAVAEQLDFPQIQCWWPADSTGLPPGDTVFVDPDSGSSATSPSSGPVTECTEVGTYSMRTLIAWEPARMAEVVRLVADLGSNQVNPGVPDVMTGVSSSPARDSAPGVDPGPGPDPLPPDTAGGGGSGSGGSGGSSGFPGFIGEYLVDDQGIWFAAEGSQTNELASSGGACTSDQASFDWAEFRCEGARFRYQFTMRVQPLPFAGGPTPLMGGDPDGTGGEHTITMASSEVDGVRLALVSWTPPPVPPAPPPGPVPPDSTPPGSVPPDSAVTNR